MPSILIIGATRGLGKALTEYYASKPENEVYGTSRSSEAPSSPSGPNIHWITSVDLSKGPNFDNIAKGVKEDQLNTAIITAGYFETEDFGQSKWDEEIKMYILSSVAPVFVVEALVRNSKLEKGSKVILVSSESGSITLRHEQEGGGNFGHHGSKAASNMVGKQLSFDLKPKGIAVGIVHPSFMRTEMTKGVGFDKFW
jgi:short-subunit dehydrogenase